MRVTGPDIAMKDGVIKWKADAPISMSDHYSESLLNGDIGRRLLSHREEAKRCIFQSEFTSVACV